MLLMGGSEGFLVNTTSDGVTTDGISFYQDAPVTRDVANQITIRRKSILGELELVMWNYLNFCVSFAPISNSLVLPSYMPCPVIQTEEKGLPSSRMMM